MIQIKRLNGNTIHTFDAVPEGSLVHMELMADHYVKLPFSLDEPIYLKVGDYIELPDFGHFELIFPYVPKFDVKTGAYMYELRLDAYYIKWKNKKCRYIPTASASETSFNLTATVTTHLNVIVNGINAVGNLDSNFRYNQTTSFRFELRNFPADKVDAAKYMKYDNIDFITALNNLAALFECEWWVEANTIYFGKCQLNGEEVEFELDRNVEEMTSSESSNEFATRIIAFGSTRNLPSNYRANQSADVTVNGVVQKRLMLPASLCPRGYVQDSTVVNETEAVEAIVIDENIYPHVDCFVSRIETYERTVEDEETGETITRTYYRLYDGSGFDFSTDMILDSKTLHILFQSGAMNGMEFECQYNNTEKYYEVVANEDYGRFLPDPSLHPSANDKDKFVLLNWDATKIAETGIIDDAEQELYRMACDKLEDMKVDPNTYTCVMRSDEYSDMMDEDPFVKYDIGQRARLINPTYFPNGRSSRIIGYDIKLDIPYDTPKYIVGEATAYSHMKDMQGQIDAITYNGASYSGNGNGGGPGIYLITSTDTTPSSDYNAYSALRSDRQYLSRKHEDTASAKITFREGLDAKHVRVTGSNGTTPDVDNITQKKVGLEVEQSGVIGGIFRVAKSILTKTIQSLNFSGGDSLTGTGWQLTDNYGNGRSRLVVDDAVFRGKVTLNELEVRKLMAMGGNYAFSPAASVIEEVDYYGYVVVPGESEPAIELLGYEYVKVPWMLRLIPLSLLGRYLSKKKWVRSTMSQQDYSRVAFYRCWLKADDGSTQTINTWKEGMLARCQTFDTSQIENGDHSGKYDSPDSGLHGKDVTNKLYWRAVTATAQGVDKNNYDGKSVVLDDGRKHNYIDLSNGYQGNIQLYLDGSDHVSAGDHIVCYGDWKDENLSHFVTIETIGDDAPAVKEFRSVGYTDGTSIDWSLDGKCKTKISPVAGNAFYAPHFYIEANGSVRDVATFMVSTDGILAEVKGVIDNGKNLLSGVLTGTGWESCAAIPTNNEPNPAYHNITVDANGNLVRANGDTYLASPVVKLEQDQTYTLSFIGGGSFIIYVLNISSGVVTEVHSTHKAGGGTMTTTFTSINNYNNVRIFIGTNVKSPQLETGEVATAFEADTTETSSRIKQTADSIEQKVNDTGIDIENKKVTIKASNFKVTDETGSVNLIEGVNTSTEHPDGHLTLTNTTVNGALVVHKEVTSGTETGSYNLEISKNDAAPYINYEIVRNERNVQGGHAKDFQSVQIDGDITNGYAVIGASGGILYDDDGEEKHRTDYYTHLFPKYLISDGDGNGTIIVTANSQSTPNVGTSGYFDNNDRVGILLKASGTNNRIKIATGVYSGYQFVIDFNNEVRITDKGAQFYTTDHSGNSGWKGGSLGKTYVVVKANTDTSGTNPNGLYLLYYGGFLIGTSRSVPLTSGWTGVTDYTGQL